jgi:hypothetical protein
MRDQSEKIQKPQNRILSAENASKRLLWHTREQRTACPRRRRHGETKNNIENGEIAIYRTTFAFRELLILLHLFFICASVTKFSSGPTARICCPYFCLTSFRTAFVVFS